MYNLQINLAQTHVLAQSGLKIFYLEKKDILISVFIIVETVIRRHLMVLRVINKREWLDGGGLQKEEK